MCRGIGEGARRCPGHNAPEAREAHNRRRRENRAIKAGVVAWACQQGVEADEINRLQAMGPKAVKDWAEDKGLDPRRFLSDDRTNAAPTRPRAHAFIAPVAAAPTVDAERRGGMFPAVAQQAQPAPTGPNWTRQTWSTPALTDQIERVLALQGDHRDERALLSGKPSGGSRARGGTNETERIELDNGVTGYHKTFSGLNHGLAQAFGQTSAQQPLHEVAAWQLAKRMGRPYEDIVPPCVLAEVNGELGSMGLERPGRNEVRQFEDSPEWKDAAFFDSLIGQQDRHHGNFMRSGDRITLIDHGYSFARDGDYLNFSQIQAKRAGDLLTRSEVAILDQLIADPDLFGLRKILEPDRADAVLKRAMRMKREGTVLAPGIY